MTQTQLEQYRRDGYTVVRGLIPRELTEPVRRRLLEFLEDWPAWAKQSFQVLDPAKFKNAKGLALPWGVQRPAQHEPIFRAMVEHPNLVAAMEQLLGGPVKLFTDQALIKHKAVDGESFYHQDSYYWHLQPELGCNAWIALDDVGPGAIALGMLPGSHQSWTLTPHEQYFDEPALFSARGGPAFQRHRIPFSQVDFSKEVLLPLAPGDAAFFTNYTWHRAEPNKSGQHKCAYAIAYQRA